MPPISKMTQDAARGRRNDGDIEMILKYSTLNFFFFKKKCVIKKKFTNYYICFLFILALIK